MAEQSCTVRTEELEKELERKTEELVKKDQAIKVLRKKRHDLEAIVGMKNADLRRKDTDHMEVTCCAQI